MRYTIEAAVRNHIGKLRKNNEDNFFLNGRYLKREQMDAGGYFAEISSDKRQLYAVCDGMGGESNGEEASYLAAERLERLLGVLDNGGQARANIDAFCDETNRCILTYGRGGHMGTTIALLCLHEEGCEVAYLGDSRVYLLRDKQLTCLTRDHTEVNRLLDMGLINEEEAQNHPDRSMLYQYLGMQYTDLLITPTYVEYTPQAGDRLLLCSDGLTDMLDDAQIAQTLLGSRTATTATKNLINRALEEGGRDNITVMVLCVRKCDDLPEHAPRHGKIRGFSRRAARARNAGSSWYRQDVDTGKEKLLSAGRKNFARPVLLALLLFAILMAAVIGVIAAGGNFSALKELFTGKVTVENSVEVVDQTVMMQSPAAQEAEPTAQVQEESLQTQAQNFVNEVVAYGLYQYQEGSASGEDLLRFALACAYARVQEYPQFQQEPQALPQEAAASAANVQLWTQMQSEGCYRFTQVQADEIVAQYMAASIPASNNYASAVYADGTYYVLPQWDQNGSRIAVSTDISQSETDASVRVQFDVYAYVQEEGGSAMVKSGTGTAVLRSAEGGRFGLQLISLSIVES